ncbi:MAG: glycosyl transferase, partial [Cyanobium sp.]
LPLPCRLRRGSEEQAAELEAISEAGVELRATEAAGGSPPDLQPLELLLPGLPPLPLQPLARQRGRLGARWGPCDDQQLQALRRFLYSREGLWPVRRAPPEPLALAVVMARLLLGCRPEGWFRRSLVPQNPPV